MPLINLKYMENLQKNIASMQDKIEKRKCPFLKFILKSIMYIILIIISFICFFYFAIAGNKLRYAVDKIHEKYIHNYQQKYLNSRSVR